MRKTRNALKGSRKKEGKERAPKTERGSNGSHSSSHAKNSVVLSLHNTV